LLNDFINGTLIQAIHQVADAMDIQSIAECVEDEAPYLFLLSSF
jgi:EAL domain-containing protein (putative c-di-GMP-specific phosphodiesterase class I)